MNAREEFRALALAHGMRDPHFIELAEVAGLVRNIDTKAGREESLRRFKAEKPHLFGSDHGNKTMLESMNHARFDGKSDAQARADRKTALDRHVGAYLGPMQRPEKSAVAMTREEADALQREIVGREEANLRTEYRRAVHNKVLGE